MRQVFQLTTDSEKDAYFLQHRISNYLRVILSVLQKVLDEICADDQTIVIDKLEIDLGDTPMNAIRDDSWMAELEEALREGLRQLLIAHGTADAITRTPGSAGVFGQWLFSMKRGYLPWNTGKVDDQWYLQVLEAVATEDRIATELRRALTSEPIVLERVVQQHAVSFMIPLTEALTAKKQQQLAQVPEELLIMVRALEKGTTLTRREMEKIVWKKVLLLAAAPVVSTSASMGVSTEEILAMLVTALFSLEQRAWIVAQAQVYAGSLPVFWPVLTAPGIVAQTASVSMTGLSESQQLVRGDTPLLSGMTPSAPTTWTAESVPAVAKPDALLPGEKKSVAKDDAAPSREMASGVAGGGKPAGETVDGSREEGRAERASASVDAKNESAAGASTDPVKEIAAIRENASPLETASPREHVGKKRKTTVEIIGGEEIFVHHAGVVLLHPFLNAFFKILGFVAEGKFITHELHTRALYLIHFLATGATDPHEHDLLIAKILCAYPLDEPVDAMIRLTESEMEEAENLLSAAISNWSILKSTSPAGLREGFLQRSGKVQVKANDLLLLIENSSIDMLLDHLPWNLGIIKLPWMENILRIEWR